MKKIVQGLVIGIANAVPGISGATLALILGCYDDLIELMGSPYRIKTIVKHRWMVIGIIVGLFLAVFLLSYLYEKAPLLTICYFLGLIVGGLPKMIKSLNNVTILNIISFGIALLFIVIIYFLPKNTEQSDISIKTTILASGISALAMILPGVSGTLMLMALGVYFPLLMSGKTFLANFLSLNISFDKSFYIVFCFIIFLIIFLITFSKILKKLNRLKPSLFVFFSFGLVVGSIIVVSVDLFYQFDLSLNLNNVFLGLIFGVFSILLLIRKTED